MHLITYWIQDWIRQLQQVRGAVQDWQSCARSRVTIAGVGRSDLHETCSWVARLRAVQPMEWMRSITLLLTPLEGRGYSNLRFQKILILHLQVEADGVVLQLRSPGYIAEVITAAGAGCTLLHARRPRHQHSHVVAHRARRNGVQQLCTSSNLHFQYSFCMISTSVCD